MNKYNSKSLVQYQGRDVMIVGVNSSYNAARISTYHIRFYDGQIKLVTESELTEVGKVS
jgi:hypothetical protein